MLKEIDKLAEIGVKLANLGINTLPKADGRVEIPQFVVKAMGWEKSSVLYVTFEDIGMCIYPEYKSEYAEGLIGEVLNSKGRFRIPAGVIKKTQFFGQPLRFIIERERVVANLKIELDNAKQMLAKFLQKTPQQVLTKIEEEASDIKNISDNDIKPELMLLDTTHIMKFRPVGKPFEFNATFSMSKREIVFSGPRYNNFKFYLVPGIERVAGDKFKIGFLLMGPQTFHTFSAKVKQREAEEVIIWPDTFSDGGFVIYFEAPGGNHYTDDIIKLAERTCGDPKALLETHFRKNGYEINSDLYVSPPPIISKQTINLMQPEEN